NINTASKTELQTLKGIGDATAEAIIQYREQNGSFTTIEELINVKGIGSKKVEKLTDQIAVSDPE
ncbi:MAG: ComEA family DNA-binding protein, partial [Methylophagaceae bacterium]